MAEKLISVSDLMEKCSYAASKMSPKNRLRTLLYNCAYAMRQMVDRESKLVAELEAARKVQ